MLNRTLLIGTLVLFTACGETPTATTPPPEAGRQPDTLLQSTLSDTACSLCKSWSVATVNGTFEGAAPASAGDRLEIHTDSTYQLTMPTGALIGRWHIEAGNTLVLDDGNGTPQRTYRIDRHQGDGLIMIDLRPGYANALINYAANH